MATFEENLKTISTARYGSQVRTAISEAISQGFVASGDGMTKLGKAIIIPSINANQESDAGDNGNLPGVWINGEQKYFRMFGDFYLFVPGNGNQYIHCVFPNGGTVYEVEGTANVKSLVYDTAKAVFRVISGIIHPQCIQLFYMFATANGILIYGYEGDDTNFWFTYGDSWYNNMKPISSYRGDKPRSIESKYLPQHVEPLYADKMVRHYAPKSDISGGFDFYPDKNYFLSEPINVSGAKYVGWNFQTSVYDETHDPIVFYNGQGEVIKSMEFPPIVADNEGNKTDDYEKSMRKGYMQVPFGAVYMIISAEGTPKVEGNVMWNPGDFERGLRKFHEAVKFPVLKGDPSKKYYAYDNTGKLRYVPDNRVFGQSYPIPVKGGMIIAVSGSYAQSYDFPNIVGFDKHDNPVEFWKVNKQSDPITWDSMNVVDDNVTHIRVQCQWNNRATNTMLFPTVWILTCGKEPDDIPQRDLSDDIALPSKVQAMKGHQLVIYKDTLSRYDGRANSYKLSSSGGPVNFDSNGNEMCWKTTPTDTGDSSVTIQSIGDTYPSDKGKKTFTVHVNDKIAKRITRNIMIIGDSITDDNYTAQEVSNLLKADNDFDFSMVGTRGPADGLHEAHSGWTWWSFLDKNGPFGNPWSLKNYVSSNNLQRPHYVLINLGTNHLTQGDTMQTDGNSTIQNTINAAKQFLTKMLDPDTGYSDLRIAIGLICTGAEHFDNYVQWNSQVFKYSANALNHAYLDEFDNGKWNSSVTCFALGSYLNRRYAFPYVEEAVSSRYSEKVIRYQDHVHPNERGRRSLADAYYAQIRGWLSEDANN